MKFIVMIVMMSSLLLSWPKQIILGSYTVEDNAVSALSGINKKIEEDAKLQALVNEHSLKTKNTLIGDYTVVSINEFNSYVSLLRTYNVLKNYYADAYVLKYPAGSMTQMETEEALEAKASQEIADEEKRAELKKLLEEEPQESKSESESTENQEVTTVDSDAETKVKEVASKKDTVKETVSSEEEVVAEEESSGQDYLIYLVGLAILILIIAGIVMSQSKKSQPKREIRTLEEDE